jgi:serine protease Do
MYDRNHSSSVAKKKTATHLFLGFALLALVCVATGAVAMKTDRQPEPPASLANVEEMGKAFAYVTKLVEPAVTFIKVEKQVPFATQTRDGQGLPPGLQDDWLRRFFGDQLPEFNAPRAPRGDRRSFGQGSGFVISEDGYILTNNHVVQDASRVTVTLADGREFEAEVIGTDPRSDVAVIKIDGRNLPKLQMGDSDGAEVGEWVLAIGSPFGLSGTVTSGIVSAKGRDSMGITDYEDFIQTDAAINPGNSGGPLVNLKGEVIGINTAIASRTGVYNGIGFAIPINMARSICDQLIEDGTVERGYLGIMIQKLTPDLARSFSLEEASGVLVGDVPADSPADEAGLQPGDVIVEFDGKRVQDLGSFRNLVAATAPETSVKIAVLRDGTRRELNVTLGRLPVAAKGRAAVTESIGHLGLRVGPLTDEARERFDWRDEVGVMITEVDPGSNAAGAGLQPGMLIQEVNRRPVNDVREFRKLITESKEDGSVLLRIRQGDSSRYVVLRLDG